MSTGSNIEISAPLLRTLHRIHRQLTDLRGRISRGPRQIKAGEAMVLKVQTDMDDLQQKLKKAKIASDEKQLQLRSREARIEEIKVKLNTASSNREFTTWKEQIAADEQANSVLSDEILEGLESLDELEAELKALKSELEKQESEHEQRVQEVQAKMESLRGELARVENELVETEKQIPSAVRADYDRLTKSKGEEALAPIDGDSCGGCYQTLTTQVMSQLQLSRLVRCPNCNAFLYLPENRRVT
ncbi:Chromosome partition protein Smc [Novipirellula galeiformis]|uniref:Chromosome partition protein Smc n=1 Tax=Novipirellula galeiformis TaxID=2528004 RepID=A0A5C6C940_9BACT|nr:C4-type zinc ribbon domain-containing protein [Novipirellula galeiformis]TWU20595.1 Chromosome partition protein Smc [Novipirellula galeiformis]